MATEKQIKWANDIKAQKIKMVRDFAEANDLMSDEHDAALINQLVEKLEAKSDPFWWIDHRSPGWDTDTLAEMMENNRL